jgi:triphosphoribosyl-dephospho-CoA synthetase
VKYEIKKTPEAIKKIVQAVISTVKNLVDSIISTIKTIGLGVTEAAKKDNGDATSSEDLQNKNKLTETFQKIFESSVGAIIGKYKVAILGVINSLTGSPSGYFHVQVGNPKRPTFSSGDMIVEDVTLTLGPVLSWNDLPSSIKAEFTLTNARPLGADELYSRFNNSQARAYVRNKDYYQENATTQQQVLDQNGQPTGEYITKDADAEEALKALKTEETNNGPAKVSK